MWGTTRTIAIAATSILTAGAAAVGVGAISSAQAAAPAATTTTLHCHPLKTLPANLRADLKKARQQPAGKRGPALRAIRQKALHGDYGSAAKSWSERRIEHHALVVAQRPVKLREALRAVHKLPVDQRWAKRVAIRDSVLAGDYGKQAQQQAQRVKAHRAACKAQRH